MGKLASIVNVVLTSVRYIRRSHRPYLRDLYYRRLAQGPEPFRPRSAWLCWDNDAERTAFLHRIRGSISLGGLNRALIDRSFTHFVKTQPNAQEVSSKTSEDNAELTNLGRQVTHDVLLCHLRSQYPRVPEQCVRQLVHHLMTPYQLANTASFLGLKDLVLYAVPSSNQANTITSPVFGLLAAPPALSVLADCLLAVIGTMADEKKHDEVNIFIRDFILAAITDLDSITDVLTFDEPGLLLAGALSAQGRGPPEIRLQWQSGMNTLLSCYQVGVYSDRELIGEAPGETIEVAEEEATLQALYNVLEIPKGQPVLSDSKPASSIDSLNDGHENVSLSALYQLARQTEQTNAAMSCDQ